MEYITTAETLTFLWEALNKKPSKPRPWQAYPIFERIVKKGWAFSSELEDIFYCMEPRLAAHQFKIIEMSKACGLNWQSVYYRPRAKSNGVTVFDALRAEDAVIFLITMERLGFQVDATELVRLLLPAIKSRKKELLSSAELQIFWFNKVRHKYSGIDLRIEKLPEAPWETKRITTETGYKVEGKFDQSGRPILFTVSAPKYRERREPVETKCPDCGDTWYRGDPDSSAGHRREHRRRMAYLNPQPLAAFLEEKKSSNDPELVTSSSPAWKHKEMYERALAFKRELHFDFIQWGSPPTGDNDPNVHGFLFTNEQGAVIGACAFRDRTGDDKVPLWGMQWIWICPKERRKGHLSRRWKMLKDRFGDFVVESPASNEMEAFLRKQGDEQLLHWPSYRKKTEVL